MKACVLAILSGFVALAFNGPASADDAANCKAPAWAPQSPPGYEIKSCESHAFGELKLSLASGQQTVSGHSTSVTYALIRGAKDHPAAEVRKFYVDAATTAGATLRSRPGDSYSATLEKNTGTSDEWMLYEHNGNENSTSTFTLITFDTGSMQQEVVAQPMTGPLDIAPKTCVDPPWLKQQFSYFKVGGCQGKAWDSVRLSLPGGEKTIEGQHLTVTYRLTDQKKAPTALAVQKNYVDALQAIGAKLVSSPNNHNQAVLTQQTNLGEVWYVYSQGDGNDQFTASYSVGTVVIAPLKQEVVAQAMTAPMSGQGPGAECSNPPWLKKQFDYFTLKSCGYRDVDQITLDLPGGKKTLAGRYMEATYELNDQRRDPTALAVQKNYVAALQAIGAQLVSKPDNLYAAVLTQKTPVGDLWYVYKHDNGNENSTTMYSLLTVEVGGPPPKACTLEVYGVNFDFNKAILRPDSDPVLQQVLALFTDDSSYSAELSGHTDNIGKEDYNMKLSRDRADAVKTWLVAHGVNASRITTNGYGDTRPLVPNNSDANRFKNRRVELKRNNCKG